MTKSKTDTKKNFSPANNKFIVDVSGVIKVMCLDCKSVCGGIPLPNFTMYFCENPICDNNLELRYLANDKSFELHDYGAVFSEEEFQTSVDKLIDEQKLLVRPERTPAPIIQFPTPAD